MTPTREDLSGYDSAREPRWRHQREKCAYCDRDVALLGQPVEHFRPVLGGYWWLAWSWDNLLFACVSCNSAKSNHFPLRAGSALTPGEPPPGQEQPYLASPYEEDPTVLVGFEEDADGRWVPRGLDAAGRGQKIIEILRLEQHVDAYTRWVRDNLVHDLDAIQAAIDTDDADQVLAKWELFWARHDTEFARFRLLTRAAALQRFSMDVRARWGLQREAPRTPSCPETPEQERERGLLERLVPSTRELVYALGGRASDGDWDHALSAILSHEPWHVDDLCVLCCATRETVTGHLRRLETQKMVVLSGRGVARAAALD